MIISFIELLELPIFGHTTTFGIQFELQKKKKNVGDVLDRDYDVITFISKYLNFKKTYSSQFCCIIKFISMFIKTIFKSSKKLKRVTEYLLKCNLYYVFLVTTKVADFQRKMSPELKRCVTRFMYFLDLLQVR